MIRFSTCVTYTIVFLAVILGVAAVIGYIYGDNQFHVVPPLAFGYLCGLNRMRLLANQGREGEEQKHGPSPLTGRWAPRGTYQRPRWKA